MEKQYRYMMCGMFDGLDGCSYSIEIPSPYSRNSEQEAMKDGSIAYRFISDGTEPVIVCYENEKYVAKTDNKGHKYLETWVEGNVLAIYTFEDFLQYGGVIRKLKDESKNKFCIDLDDFEDIDKKFIDIFPSIPLGKLYYIDNEAY